MNTVSGVFQLTVTKDGDTLGGCLLVKGILDQQKNKDSGAFVPDYTQLDSRPEIFPRVTSAIKGGAVTGLTNFTNVKWYFNSEAIEDGNANFEFANEGEAGSEVPSLIIKGNPVDVDGAYEIRFEADVNNGSSKSKVIFVTKLTLSTVSTAAYTVVLKTKYGGIVNGEQSEVLTPYLRLGTNEVSSGVFYKYYKMVNGSWTAFGSNATSRGSITITNDDVNGIDLFKVDVHIGNADGAIICSDVQEVIDDSDPYQIVAAVNTFSFGSPQQTITPKVYKGENDVTASESWTITSIKLIFSDGSEQKSSTSGSIQISFDEVKDDAGVPYLYITASK